MKRKIEQKLIDWKNSKNRMPLIVNGARQIGKTYSVLEFGMKNYQNVVHINLEKNKLASLEFERDLSSATLVLKLESLTKERILPEKSLLFLDEIQASERSLTSLKLRHTVKNFERIYCRHVEICCTCYCRKNPGVL